MSDPAASFRRRFIGLTAAVALIVIAATALAFSVGRQASGNLKQLADVELESALLVRPFRAAVDDLHAAMLRLGSAGAEGAPRTVNENRQVMNDWLRQRSASSYSPGERIILDRITQETRRYFAMVDRILTGPDAFKQEIPHDTVVQLDAQVNRLQRSIDDFAVAEDAELKNLLETSLASVVWLRNLVFACLAVLLGALALLVRFLYRDVVRPLRKQLVERDAQLAEREKLAALGTLAAGVAHEIRNPLTAIKGRLYMLRRSTNADTRQEDEEAITREVERLERIVRDILGYARPADPSPGLIELRSWLADFAGFVQPDALARKVELRVESTDPAFVRADPNQLRQILLNLVRNALEAIGASGRGTVTLALARERRRLRGRPAEVAVLSVIDNGPGIPAEIHGRLFDPFFTTKPAGTGLGLSIVARLVENQQGEIRFRSAVGVGTRFDICLPLAPRESGIPELRNSPAEIQECEGPQVQS